MHSFKRLSAENEIDSVSPKAMQGSIANLTSLSFSSLILGCQSPGQLSANLQAIIIEELLDSSNYEIKEFFYKTGVQCLAVILAMSVYLDPASGDWCDINKSHDEYLLR